MSAPARTFVRMAVIGLATPTPGLVVVQWRDRWVVLHAESGRAVAGASFGTEDDAMGFAEAAGSRIDWTVADWQVPRKGSKADAYLTGLINVFHGVMRWPAAVVPLVEPASGGGDLPAVATSES
jgi:hypothetical protein